MRTSLWISAEHTWDEVLRLATHAEATGWDGIWIADHFMPNDDGALDTPMLECFSVLAALAAVVPRVRLGSLVAGNTYRHPAVLANQAATIDQVSGGRMVLGIGAGWQVNEHARYGIDLGTVAERIAWFDEACQVVRALRDEARATVAGERYQVQDAPMSPKPSGPLPILIGAKGERKMARIVARHADEWNLWSTPQLWVDKRAAFDRVLEDEDRDPATLYRSTQALVLLGPDGAAKAEQLSAVRPAIGGTASELTEAVGGWATAGLDEWIVPTFTLGPIDRTIEAMDELVEQVAPAFR